MSGSMLGLQRFAGGIAAQFLRRAGYSTTVRAATATTTATTNSGESIEGPERTQSATGVVVKKSRHSIVAAAFESLNNDTPSASATEGSAAVGVNRTKATETKFIQNSNNNIEERIINAKTVNGLLAITESNGPISRKHALKIVSILADWSSMNRVKLAEFENDTRFLRICRMLGRTIGKNGAQPAVGGNNVNNQKRISGFRTDDLNTVLGVAGDDEAAKLIASISLPQMVKVMSTLAQRKRRSTPLLRSLAFNISSTTEQLDLKQCADVLYAMATLNFQDSVLAAKICADIQLALPKNVEKSAVVGSILTSLGILKYRDLDILESLTQWTLQYSDICRPQDLSALFLSSALLNFKSANIDTVREKLVKSIVKQDFTKPNDWVSHVWALAMLGLAENEQLESVLSEEFIKHLQKDRSELTPTLKMKLLNLNSYAQLMAKNYKGPLLSADSDIYNVPIAHNKSKQILVNGMLDALKSLLPASNHFKSPVDSKMGFLIDALCHFDAKRNPLPLEKEHSNAIKVVLMVVDFHDVCNGTHRAVSGITNLSYDLLEKSGYKVLPVPYNEFNTSDKLLKRVQYLEKKFKSIVSSK